MLYIYFFFNDTATTEIYTLSLHDALPISAYLHPVGKDMLIGVGQDATEEGRRLGAQISLFDVRDRKSTRLNSSHANISYAVFCLKKKKKITRSMYMLIRS